MTWVTRCSTMTVAYNSADSARLRQVSIKTSYCVNTACRFFLRELFTARQPPLRQVTAAHHRAAELRFVFQPDGFLRVFKRNERVQFAASRFDSVGPRLGGDARSAHHCQGSRISRDRGFRL